MGWPRKFPRAPITAMDAHPLVVSRSGLARFILFVAAVITVASFLYPPFTSFSGVERAFVLTGPEWSRRMGDLGENLGLTPRLHWGGLLVQLGALWAIAIGARVFLRAPNRPGDQQSTAHRRTPIGGTPPAVDPRDRT